MGCRFGKYGDAKRKVQFCKKRLRLPDLRQPAKDKPLKGPRKSKVPQGVQTEER